MNLDDNKANELLYVSFNQDYGCFACGTSTGFFICDSNPLKERFRRGSYTAIPISAHETAISYAR
jgi:WD repeat-containing protein 45